MRTVGAGANIKKGGSAAELETENRMLREANEGAESRINELEIMLDESREEAAVLQKQLDEERKAKASKEKNTGK